MEAAVVDPGSSLLKAGFAIPDQAPAMIIPTQMKRILDDGSMTDNPAVDDVAVDPVWRGYVRDWDAMEDLLHYVLYTGLGWEMGNEGQILFTDPLCTPKANKEQLVQLMFETFNISGFYASEQAVLSLYAVGRISGCTVDIGHGKIGKLLQATRTKLFWTPCAAHCLDLMLEDIGKIAKVKRVIQRGIKLVGYIYNHSLALNTMRKFTNKSELVRHGVTRFATTFLTLQRLHKQKANLRRMFTSDEWVRSKAAKDPKGKKATDIVLMPSFWNDVVYTLKAMGPIVRVLRLVDNEKRPAMGYIYEAMDRAKEAIQKAFNGNEDKYKDIFVIIDRRWDCQLHHPLHAAGYFLNPEFFYSNPNIERECEVVDGLYKCIDKLSENDEFVDHIHNQLPMYKRAVGMFGYPAAVRKRTTMAPDIAPVIEGAVNHIASRRFEFGGIELTNFLAQELGKSNPLVNISISDVEKIKQQYSCCAEDELAYQKTQDACPVETHTLPDGQVITIGRERYTIGEALFQPCLLGLEAHGIVEQLVRTISTVSSDNHRQLLENTVVCGGTSSMTGFEERFQKESSLSSSAIRPTLVKPPEYMPENLTMYSAWVGGAILAKVVFPQNQHVTKADYDETGPSIVHRKCF